MVSSYNMFTSSASGNRLYPHNIPVNLNITIEWSFPKIEVPQSSISKGLCMINHPTIGVPWLRKPPNMSYGSRPWYLVNPNIAGKFMFSIATLVYQRVIDFDPTPTSPKVIQRTATTMALRAMEHRGTTPPQSPRLEPGREFRNDARNESDMVV